MIGPALDTQVIVDLADSGQIVREILGQALESRSGTLPSNVTSPSRTATSISDASSSPWRASLSLTVSRIRSSERR